MSEPVTFGRISALSRKSVCPASWAKAEEQGLPSIKSDASSLGDAFHHYMDDQYGIDPKVSAKDLARVHMCDEARLLELIQNNTFDPTGGEKEAEVTLIVPATDETPEIHVPGHMDWGTWGIRGATRVGTVLDYKTSAHPEHTLPITRDAQLHGYAIAWADQHSLTEVTATKYFPALGNEGYESIIVDLPSAREWIYGVVRKAWWQTQYEEKHRTYRPNEMDWSVGCKGCNAVVTCEQTRFAHDRAIALMGKDPKPGITRENAIDLYEAGRMVAAGEKFRKEAFQAIAELLDEGGPIEINETHELRNVNGARGSRYPQACRKLTEGAKA